MPWFRCLVRGENFPLIIEDERRATGFYATRFVNAVDEAQAEGRVFELLRGDPALQLPPGTPGMEKARVYVEEIVAVDGVIPTNSGFTFYAEEE